MFRSNAVDDAYPLIDERYRTPSARRSLAVVKRAADLVLGLGALVVLSPLLLIVAIAVRSSSRGPALFRQQRLGRNGRTFTMLKFRTMLVDNDDSEHRAYVTAMLTPGAQVEASTNGLHKLDDERITRVGAILRRASLDELPQLFNVLRGSMSLVGPRPVLPWEGELLSSEDQVRFRVKPGMTGLWQVSGRSRLPMDVALELDREYVARQSLGLDLIILLKTIPALFAGDAA